MKTKSAVTKDIIIIAYQYKYGDAIWDYLTNQILVSRSRGRYIRMVTEIKDKVLAALASEWKSTEQVRKDAKMNWYRVEFFLNQLLSEGRIERDARSNAVYWRLKE